MLSHLSFSFVSLVDQTCLRAGWLDRTESSCDRTTYCKLLQEPDGFWNHSWLENSKVVIITEERGLPVALRNGLTSLGTILSAHFLPGIKNPLVAIVLHSMYQNVICTWTEQFFTPILSEFSTGPEITQGKGRGKLNPLLFTIYIVPLQSCSKLRDQGFLWLGTGQTQTKRQYIFFLFLLFFPSLSAASEKYTG